MNSYSRCNEKEKYVVISGPSSDNSPLVRVRVRRQEYRESYLRLFAHLHDIHGQQGMILFEMALRAFAARHSFVSPEAVDVLLRLKQRAMERAGQTDDCVFVDKILDGEYEALVTAAFPPSQARTYLRAIDCVCRSLHASITRRLLQLFCRGVATICAQALQRKMK